VEEDMAGHAAKGNAWADEAPTELTDRRAAERIHLEVEVTLGSESQFFAGLTGDISTGGLFVQTYSLRPVGSRVLVAFSLPTGEVKTPGVVRWVRRAAEGTEPGLGIAFESLRSSERESIEAFCKTRPPLYHDLDSD
jgi:uncharacterized protein (TIGR02266 family)